VLDKLNLFSGAAVDGWRIVTHQPLGHLEVDSFFYSSGSFATLDAIRRASSRQSF
jgi:hypothetical protein